MLTTVTTVVIVFADKIYFLINIYKYYTFPVQEYEGYGGKKVL